ncbi:hypothetical protein PLESTB_001482600 [Pleodorina starrii]|uniref:Calcineurin-like phosphoesterase domain-containing protein n=1 Tax=Pleodorina starrii TaxID=330485 RepID=A0A9W6BWZ5_9CHLO|nr:hypothetical protein PLESTM_000654200 [Pleodorina starrii]GLC59405.1 hypothetical protein PLESTB_001482600 [Pleodorina starrii]GLC74396.1 hypothetical protein PLESTF_001508700 [Pleodorina starrii]
MSKWLSRTVSVVVGTLFVIVALCLATERRRAEQLGIRLPTSTIVRLDSAARGGNSDSSSSGSSSSSMVQAVGSAKSSAQGAVAAALPAAFPKVGRRPSLTVVCVSDTHSLYLEEGLIKVPEGDMLLFPGDVEVGTAAEGLAFSHWLAGLPVRGPRVLTWGNMDTATPGLTDPVPGATIIVNAIVEVNGYRIFASPWTPRFAGAYQLDMGPDASYEYWSKLLPSNADVDIVLTHGPPYGIADKTNGRHRGDMGLLRAVQALQKPPLLWVCGHIHEQYGIHRVPHARAPGGHILLVNSAVFYAQRPGHARTAQPRAVRLPQVEILPRNHNG